MPHHPPPAPPSPPSAGFGHSTRRVVIEIVAVVAVLALAVWGVMAATGAAAGWLAGLAPTSLDEAIGEYAWPQLAPEERRCTDPAPLAYVEALAAPLVEAYDGPYTFRFAVVDDPAINAFALPGGYVTVHMGLLDAADSGEEVAAVLAHEMRHVTERHGLRRIARQLGGAAALGMIFGAADLGALGGVAIGLMGRAYDRDQEREADEEGHALLVAAQIDPRGMVTFFDRLAREGGSMPAILSTHPGSAERSAAAAARAGLDGPPRTLPAPGELRCR